MFDYGERQRRLREAMSAASVDLLFLPPSSDLEYLTGLERPIPTFGQTSHPSDWISGAFFRPGGEPLYVLPRMTVVYDLGGEAPGEVVVVGERDDGIGVLERVVRGLGPAQSVAVGDRVWAETVLNLQRVLGSAALRTGSAIVGALRRTKSAEELETMERACRVADETMAEVSPRVVPGVTMAELVEEVEHQLRIRGSRAPSFTTRVFTGFGPDALDSEGPSRTRALADGQSVMFDFGAVVDGYCSDFGRAIFCGEPSDDDRVVYAVMLAAQEAGRVALRPGVPASEVNRACRGPIEEAGLGEYFMHRMGHGIGLDVHERPFLSEEDPTPLEVGMTFTDEPSILRPGRASVRIEDVVVCEDDGGRKLNRYPVALVANT